MAMSSILRTIFKTIAKEKKGTVPNWRYTELDNTPFLYSSERLWLYVKHATKKKDSENAQRIVNYIKRFEANDIKSYQIILKSIKKNFKDIDITDLL
jgi:hypothetical protein